MDTLSRLMKLHLGAGRDIRAGWINHDVADLQGIDVRHDLNLTPWPWEDQVFEEVEMLDVLEHLDSTISTFEQLYRIMRRGGILRVRVPHWNHSCAYIDPTHVRAFHSHSFHFFDDTKSYGKDRSYYSSIRFRVIRESLVIVPGEPFFSIRGLRFFRIENKFLFRVFSLVADYIPNIVADIEVELMKVEE